MILAVNGFIGGFMLCSFSSMDAPASLFHFVKGFRIVFDYHKHFFHIIVIRPKRVSQDNRKDSIAGNDLPDIAFDELNQPFHSTVTRSARRAAATGASLWVSVFLILSGASKGTSKVSESNFSL